MTDVEKKLWKQLRAKRFAGYKFKRQVPMQRYIADFICYQPKLIIELDGGQHAERTYYDRRRDAFFVSQGFEVLRFWNNEVNENMDGVMQTILDILMKIPPLPNPLPQGERELEGAL
jgi:very-short-patch-repair endonuclease